MTWADLIVSLGIQGAKFGYKLGNLSRKKQQARDLYDEQNAETYNDVQAAQEEAELAAARARNHERDLARLQRNQLTDLRSTFLAQKKAIKTGRDVEEFPEDYESRLNAWESGRNPRLEERAARKQAIKELSYDYTQQRNAILNPEPVRQNTTVRQEQENPFQEDAQIARSRARLLSQQYNQNRNAFAANKANQRYAQFVGELFGDISKDYSNAARISQRITNLGADSIKSAGRGI